MKQFKTSLSAGEYAALSAFAETPRDYSLEDLNRFVPDVSAEARDIATELLNPSELRSNGTPEYEEFIKQTANTFRSWATSSQSSYRRK
jgi:hypothetical protein